MEECFFRLLFVSVRNNYLLQCSYYTSIYLFIYLFIYYSMKTTGLHYIMNKMKCNACRFVSYVALLSRYTLQF